jgi:DNA topoisomerase-1
VLAAIVQLLERTHPRRQRALRRAERLFGLTTMRNRHVRVKGATQWNSSSAARAFHRIAIDDPQLARIVRRCRDLPGQELFQYLDESGAVQSIGHPT